MTHYPITPEDIRANLQVRINETSAELNALKAVKIDTKQKTLTNRAVSGEGARIGDYMDIGKALFVSYTIKHADGHMRYASRDITAYSYYDENGNELSTGKFIRDKRTITPVELAVTLKDVIEGLANALGGFQSEYRRADSIAKKHNALAEKVNAFNDSISYATKAQL